MILPVVNAIFAIAYGNLKNSVLQRVWTRDLVIKSFFAAHARGTLTDINRIPATYFSSLEKCELEQELTINMNNS